jgi:hypothetical protein
MDVTGNDARLTGGVDIQDCGELPIGAGLDIDVVIPPPGIDPAVGLNGYQLDLLYDPNVVNVGAEDFSSYLLNQAPGSFLLPLSSGSPGDYQSAATELGAPADPEPAGVSEVGPGVVVRFTLTPVAPGVSPLALSGVILVGADKAPIPVDGVFGATVLVDGSCAPGVAADADSDGFTDGEELFAGTDPSDDCPDDLDDDAWPADVAAAQGYGKHDGTVSILDVVRFTPPYFRVSAGYPNYSVRRDLNGDGTIDILDLARVTPPVFGGSCAP